MSSPLNHQPSQSVGPTQQPHARNRTPTLATAGILLAFLHPSKDARVAKHVPRLNGRRIRQFLATDGAQPGVDGEFDEFASLAFQHTFVF